MKTRHSRSLTIATIALATVAFACLLGQPAQAQPTAPDGGAPRAKHAMAEAHKRFAAADTNRDGKLSKEEAQAGMPLIYKHFDEIDAAHAGSVTEADIAKWMKAKRAERNERGRASP